MPLLDVTLVTLVLFARNAGGVLPLRSAAEFARECESNSSNTIHIRKFMGREGNHLHQLTNALGIATFLRRESVIMPRWVDSVFNFTDGRVNASGFSNPNCTNFEVEAHKGVIYDCEYVFRNWCVTTAATRRKLYGLIKPYLSRNVWSACEPFDGLVIHVRDGDVSSRMNSVEHSQPPCAYFKSVIQSGNYESVLLVHSGGYPASICVKVLRDAYPGVVYEHAGSILRDACSILTAKNLALTSSSFGITLSMMSSSYDRLYLVDPLKAHTRGGMLQSIYRRKVKDFELDLGQLCEAYNATEITKYEVVRDNQTEMFFASPAAYFYDYPKTALKISTC